MGVCSLTRFRCCDEVSRVLPCKRYCELPVLRHPETWRCQLPSMFEPEGVHTQEPSSQQGAQQRPRGQFTPVAAYEQLANLLRANPDASPLIAQALHNIQQAGPGGQGSGMGLETLQQPSSSQDILDREPSRYSTAWTAFACERM